MKLLREKESVDPTASEAKIFVSNGGNLLCTSKSGLFFIQAFFVLFLSRRRSSFATATYKKACRYFMDCSVWEIVVCISSFIYYGNSLSLPRK